METIYSLVTKPINQNVSIVRVSGPETFTLLRDIFSPSIDDKGNEAIFRKLYDSEGNFIDDVIVLTFKNPSSYTGENLIEIQSHGSMFVVDKILNLIAEKGIRMATPGEFTKQAFENGKFDLSQAEAINALINAETKALAEMSSKNLNGKQSDRIDDSISKLTNIIVNIKTAMDFPENQDMEVYSNEFIRKELETLLSEMNENIKQSKTVQKIDKGIKLTIIGVPNSGKSTLLNELLNEERAIVSDVAGTTRDIIEASLLIGDIKYTLQDTAGLRDTDDKVENIGIEFAVNKIKESDLVVCLIDSTKNVEEQKKELEKQGVLEDVDIFVFNKIDSPKNKVVDQINISASQGDIDELIEAIQLFTRNKLDIKEVYDSVLINQSQIKEFSKVRDLVSNSVSNISQDSTLDIVIFDIEEAVKILGNMKGLTIDKEYFDNVFSTFCVGK